MLLRWRGFFGAVFLIAAAVFIALVGLVFIASAAAGGDVGEEGYSIGIGAAFFCVALVISVTAAPILRKSVRLSPLAGVAVTVAATLAWVTATAATNSANRSAGTGPTPESFSIILSTGLTIPAALVGLVGLIVTTAIHLTRKLG